MLKDKRKTRRQSMRYTAWIAPKPGDLHGCVLSDISDTGARISVEDADKLPDSFMLLLARNGKALRPCRVIWRKPQQLGVTFVTHLAKSRARRTGADGRRRCRLAAARAGRKNLASH